MIELRWVTSMDMIGPSVIPKKTLQYRQCSDLVTGVIMTEWSDWKDVPETEGVNGK